MGIDLVVFGNHEFDFGPEILRERMDESNFVWLGTNVCEQGRSFHNSVSTWVCEVGEHQVGFMGLCTPATVKLSNPGPNLDFLPVIETARDAVQSLQQQGADLIIALTHQTMSEDIELVEAVPEISLVLGGHEHQPATRMERKRMVQKSGHDAHYLCRIDIDLEAVWAPRWQMIANRDETPNPILAEVVNDYQGELDGFLDEKVGVAAADIDGRWHTVHSRHSDLGALFADALRHQLETDCALLNGGFIHGDQYIAQGEEVTRRAIYVACPYPNIGMAVAVTGRQLLEILEHGLSQLHKPTTRFPQVSGIRVTYVPERPIGGRIVHLEVAGKPVQLDRVYTMAITDFLYRGGNGYDMISDAPVCEHPKGRNAIHALVLRYLESRESIAPSGTGAVTASP